MVGFASRRRASGDLVVWRERSRLVRLVAPVPVIAAADLQREGPVQDAARSPALLVTFADKAAVRDHVAALGGAGVPAPGYAVLVDDPAGLARTGTCPTPTW